MDCSEFVGYSKRNVNKHGLHTFGSCCLGLCLLRSAKVEKYEWVREGRAGGARLCTRQKKSRKKFFFFLSNTKSPKSHQRKFTGIFLFDKRNTVRRVEIFLALRSWSV